jgi:hypothetical protein
VGIARRPQPGRLEDQGLIPGRGNRFFLLYNVKPARGLTRTPVEWVPGAVSPGVKRLWREVDRSPPSSAKAKNGGAVPPFQ